MCDEICGGCWCAVDCERYTSDGEVIDDSGAESEERYHRNHEAEIVASAKLEKLEFRIVPRA